MVSSLSVIKPLPNPLIHLSLYILDLQAEDLHNEGSGHFHMLLSSVTFLLLVSPFPKFLLLLCSSCSCLSDSETRCHNVVHCQGKFFCCAIEFLLQRSVVWPRSGS